MKNHEAEVIATGSAQGVTPLRCNPHCAMEGNGARSGRPNAALGVQKPEEGRTGGRLKRIRRSIRLALALAAPLLLMSCAQCPKCGHSHASMPETAATDSKPPKHPATQGGEKGSASQASSASKRGARAAAVPVKSKEWTAPRAEYPPTHPTPPRWR